MRLSALTRFCEERVAYLPALSHPHSYPAPIQAFPFLLVQVTYSRTGTDEIKLSRERWAVLLKGSHWQQTSSRPVIVPLWESPRHYSSRSPAALSLTLSVIFQSHPQPNYIPLASCISQENPNNCSSHLSLRVCAPHPPPVPTLSEPLPSPLLHFVCLFHILPAQRLTFSSLSWFGDLLLFHEGWEHIHQYLGLERTYQNSFPSLYGFTLTDFFAILSVLVLLVQCFELQSNFYRLSTFFVFQLKK